MVTPSLISLLYFPPEPFSNRVFTASSRRSCLGYQWPPCCQIHQSTPGLHLTWSKSYVWRSWKLHLFWDTFLLSLSPSCPLSLLDVAYLLSTEGNALMAFLSRYIHFLDNLIQADSFKCNLHADESLMFNTNHSIYLRNSRHTDLSAWYLHLDSYSNSLSGLTNYHKIF